MNKGQMKIMKFLPAIIFALVAATCIMTGWLIGTSLGGSFPEIWFDSSSAPEWFEPSTARATGEGGVRGGLLGLIIGSFFSFGSFGLMTAWVWRKKYPNMSRKHSLLLVLGWMFIPVVILFLMAWLF